LGSATGREHLARQRARHVQATSVQPMSKRKQPKQPRRQSPTTLTPGRGDVYRWQGWRTRQPAETEPPRPGKNAGKRAARGDGEARARRELNEARRQRQREAASKNRKRRKGKGRNR
jgi:hypothetical protein